MFDLATVYTLKKAAHIFTEYIRFHCLGLPHRKLVHLAAVDCGADPED